MHAPTEIVLYIYIVSDIVGRPSLRCTTRARYNYQYQESANSLLCDELIVHITF